MIAKALEDQWEHNMMIGRPQGRKLDITLLDLRSFVKTIDWEHVNKLIQRLRNKLGTCYIVFYGKCCEDH